MKNECAAAKFDSLWKVTLGRTGNVTIKGKGRTVFSGTLSVTGFEPGQKGGREKVVFIAVKPAEYSIQNGKARYGKLLVNQGKGVAFQFIPPGPNSNLSLTAEGKVLLPGAIPGLVKPSKEQTDIFSMTCGQPVTNQFNSVYFLKNDLMLETNANERVIAPGPKECRIRLNDQKKITLIFHRDYYRRNFNPHYRPKKKTFSHPPVGWLSWYCFFGDFDEEKTLKITDFAAKHLKDFGFQYVQLENWQQNSRTMPPSGYYHSLECDPEKFPHGMKFIADYIRQKGLKPGIWVVPLGTGDEKFFKENKKMFLVDKQGNPVISWSGKYTLDPTHPKAREYIYNMFHTINHEWGYEYMKVDGMEIGGDYYADTLYYRKDIQKLFHRKEKDPLRKIALLIRKAIGTRTFFTVCGGKVNKNGKFVGVGNAARIGGDVFFEGENPQWGAVFHTAAVTTQTYHVHNIFWFNDPDVLSIRLPLSKTYAQVLSTIVGLTGQLLFSGDIIYELSAERVRILQQLMPVPNIYPANFYPVKETKDIWNLIIRTGFEQWNVVALFNWSEKENKKVVLEAKTLGLVEDKEYLLYEFWNDEFCGSFAKTRELLLPVQSCLLLAIREKKNHPQIISVNRHLTQDAVSLSGVTWSQKNLLLSGRSEVPGNFDYIITIHLPGRYKVKSVFSDAGEINFQEFNSGIVKVVIKCLEKSTVNWKINF